MSAEGGGGWGRGRRCGGGGGPQKELEKAPFVRERQRV